MVDASLFISLWPWMAPATWLKLVNEHSQERQRKRELLAAEI